jgi:hypothetical protein
MRYTLSSLIVCALALCSVGFAQKGQAEKPDPDAKSVATKNTQNLRIIPVNVGRRDPSQYVPYSDFFPASGGTVDVNVAGTPSYDGAGASCNVRVTVAAPSGKDAWTGIGWDVTLTATSPSWRSEIAVLITNVNGEGYVLRPGAADTSSGTGNYSSGGINDLCGVYGFPPLPLPDGNLYLEFFETFNDFPDCGQDGNWDSGTLTFAFGNAPPFTGYDEQGDAGELPETAQATPSGTLTAIRGTLGAADADMYAIYITDPMAFSASTIAPPGSCIPGQAAFDTQLFLFDADGKGVVHNDDFGSTTRSRIDNSTFCISEPGLYYLAITRYNRDPIGCDDDFIWANSPFGAIRCPDGPEATSRVKGWSGAPAAGGSYIIFLTGAEGANPGDPSDCPPPPPSEPWDENANGGGDAGDLPSNAQNVYSPTATPCETRVNPITGDNGVDDVDMFVICITDPASFVASTVGGASWDTQLWLFRCDGTGVVHNDDSGGLQSRIDNSVNCITEPGTYILAISRYNRDAVDTDGQPLWSSGALSCATNSNPIAGWTGSTAAGGAYTINLRGAYFVSQNGCEGGPGQCEGDANRDGRVDDADLLIVLFQFGQSGFGLQGDVDNDGDVDDADLLIVLFNFGCGS